MFFCPGWLLYSILSFSSGLVCSLLFLQSVSPPRFDSIRFIHSLTSDFLSSLLFLPFPGFVLFFCFVLRADAANFRHSSPGFDLTLDDLQLNCFGDGVKSDQPMKRVKRLEAMPCSYWSVKAPLVIVAFVTVALPFSLSPPWNVASRKA